MKFSFDERTSESPLVDTIWRTESAGIPAFISVAESRWGIVVTKQKDKMYLTVRGPETKAMLADVPNDAEFFGINFRLGTYLYPFPASRLVNGEIHLPESVSRSFWLHGAAWEFPNFDNADVFVDRLVRQGLLMRDEVVEGVLQDHPQAWSIRTIRRRFLHATGLTHSTIRQIERARKAVFLLEQGVSILDTMVEAGYFDQPHMTRSLKQFVGQTPAQLLANRPSR